MALPLLAAAGISAIPSVAGFVGNMFDRKRRRGQEDKAAKGISNLADIFKEQLGTNYFNTAEGKGAMNQIDEDSQNNLSQINATANMSGMTDEARIAMLGQNMKAKQGALGGLAQNSDLWRQRALQNYGGTLGSLFQVGMNNRRNTQQSLNNIVGGMQSGIDGAMNAGAFDSWFGKSGGTFKPSGTMGSGGFDSGQAFKDAMNTDFRFKR
jgi:hypothetical protein